MNKVVTINLNQNAYQVEEAGYEALRAYLDKAAAKLADNPDKDEIMADFEQAIADKCAKFLRKGKTVITAAEITDVLGQMGPVEDADKEESGKEADVPTGPKRLFKIREGAVFEGVCNGIAVYFDLDPTIVRVGFIILTVVTGGAWIIAYILMALFMPTARTAEDIATAQGKAFNARTLLDQAQERYEYWKKFGKEYGQEKAEEWKKHHPHHHGYPKASDIQAEAVQDAKKWAGYKKSWKQESAANLVTTIAESADPHHRPRRGGQRTAGFLGGLGGLVLALLGIAWIWQIIILWTGGSVFGYFGGVSPVAVTVLVSAAFYAVFLPLQAVVGSALRYAKADPAVPNFWGELCALILWLGAVGTIWYLAHTNATIATDLVRMYQDIAHYFGA